MATLRDYFDRDFTRDLNVAHGWQVHTTHGSIDTPARVHLDFDSGTTYVSYFVPACGAPLAIARALLGQTEKLLQGIGVEVQSGLPGERLVSSKELIFSGRVFVYIEDAVPENDIDQLMSDALATGLRVRYRGPAFAHERSKFERPFAFISHDTRDKDDVARPIAIGLQKLMRPVWFDEFSLKVGDSLRGSIEHGLKESKKCILVLSPKFLANTGWTKVEFNSIFTRELIERDKIVLPVWHGVTAQQIYEYCPSLADRVGLQWSLGADEVLRRLYHALGESSNA